MGMMRWVEDSWTLGDKVRMQCEMCGKGRGGRRKGEGKEKEGGEGERGKGKEGGRWEEEGERGKRKGRGEGGREMGDGRKKGRGEGGRQAYKCLPDVFSFSSRSVRESRYFLSAF